MRDVYQSDVNGKGPSTLVVAGDLILDEYLRGSVNRTSPEADVPVVEQEETEYFPGGAANVASNIAALGIPVVLVGAVGDDEEGKRLLSLLAGVNVDVSEVQILSSRPTSRKTRIIGERQHIVRIDREVVHPLEEGQQLAALDSVRRCLPRALGLVCSDYNKGFLCEPVIRALVHEATCLGKKVIVDPKTGDWARYAGASILTPNLTELQLLSGLPVTLPSEIDIAAQVVLQKAKPGALLVTCGADGMILYEPKKRGIVIPSTCATPRDVNGAGDTCIAAFAWAYLACGRSLEEAATVANNAGGIAVAKLGTAIVTKCELEASWKDSLVGSGTPPQSKLKVVGLEKLLSQMQLMRRLESHGKVVFTNGCFDLLHVGHIEYLNKAKALGSLLVVGLNTDASVRRLKGDKRPIVPQFQRADMLAALECVDYIVLFEEDTPLTLIGAIQPDILVKGNDYQLHEVVGRDVVEAAGGKVELVPFCTDVSTSSVIQTIVRRYSES
jgi:D-beta-D-heptose 7-phosphate kinase/D-beta-D-heptose 1-phosphate adenosyltransferase